MPADITLHQLFVRLSAVVPADITLLSNRIYFVLWFFKSASVARLTNIQSRHSSKPFHVSRKPMTEQHEIKTFDDLSEKYSTWIIKYCSTSFESSLFMIWYTDTDENSTDRLLSFKSEGNICIYLSAKFKSNNFVFG